MSCSRKPCTTTHPPSQWPKQSPPSLHDLQILTGTHSEAGRLNLTQKYTPKILREPAARDFKSKGESQPLKGCPEPCLQGRREEMAQQSTKRHSATHLLQHVGTLQTFDEDKISHEYTM